MSSTVEQVKERLSIVDVVGQYVKLTKAGKNYKGLSPFKKEKTPSFYVQPDKGMYYDFSTNQGGDMFTFIEKMEGVDFRGALHTLAAKAGVEVVKENKDTRDKRERLYDICEQACRFYETKLEEHTEALDYLRKRALTDPTRRQFRIGFAPDGWETLRTFMVEKGYTDRELEEAGLTKHKDGGKGKPSYDRFRSRIMFPIADGTGRIVAFSGRIFGPAAEDKDNAKYLNSPETPLFDKGRTLYGYDKAKGSIRKHDFSILVEGQMDLVLSHQIGFTNTVAVSGTGLTEHHVTLLARLSNRLVAAFDADEAGIRSALRTAELTLPRGMDVKVARVPHGKDPADCIQENPDLWKQAVGSAEHVVGYALGIVEGEAKDARAFELLARERVVPLVAAIPNAIDRVYMERFIADRIGVSEEAVHEEVQKSARAGAHARARVEERQETTVDDTGQKERLSPKEELARAIAGIMYWQDGASDRVLTEEMVEEVTTGLPINVGGLLARYEAEKDTLALKAELSEDTTSDVQVLFTELVRRYVAHAVRDDLDRVTRDLKSAERTGDTDRIEALLAESTTLARTLQNLAK